MWPKALLELAPHLIRLVPMADRFLQSRSAGDDANRQAIEAMAESLRGELGHVTASHSGLYRQLNEMNEKLAGIAADVNASKAAAESVEGRLARLQRRVGGMTKLLIAAVALNVALLLLVIMLLLRH
jgi:hypothetical protein